MPAEVRVLVAGLGNVLLADDGFGVEVVRRLASGDHPPGVEIADFGVRGIHLAYELASDVHDVVFLVDAVSRGGEPGSLYVIEPTPGDDEDSAPPDAHALTPDTVLAWLRRIGGTRARVFVVGCEPALLDEQIGLSDRVHARVDDAVALVRRLIEAEISTCA